MQSDSERQSNRHRHREKPKAIETEPRGTLLRLGRFLLMVAFNLHLPLEMEKLCR